MSTVAKFKKGEMTFIEYAAEYVKIIYGHDLDMLADELDGKVLLCHCDKRSMCHRMLLGLYLRLETGCEVEEIGGFAEELEELVRVAEPPVEIYLSDENKAKYGWHEKFEDDAITGHWRELKSAGADVRSLFTSFEL